MQVHQPPQLSIAQKAMNELIESGIGEKMMGAYEGASRFDNTLALWSPPMASADSAIDADKDIGDARTLDIQRNDGYAQSGQALHKDNIVGHMFLFNSKPSTSVLRLDETWEREFQEEVENKFMLTAESPGHYLDASRNNTLTAQVRLAIGVYAQAGEFLATAEWMRNDSTRPCQTAIQAIDVARLKTPYEYQNDENVRQGLRRDRFGAILGGYIRDKHPGEFFPMSNGNFDSYKYIRAKKPWGRNQLIYIREQMRPGQTRGISEIVAGLKELKITKKFRDVTLQNAVTNAMYAAAVESELPSETVFQQLGGGNMTDPGEAVSNYASQYLSAVSEYTGGARNMHIDGVKIPHLFPGTKLNLMPAGKVGGIGQDFEKSLLRYISSILGVSYEQLSKDYSETNYSSARAAMVEAWKFMMSRKRVIADAYANIVLRLWFEEMVGKGELDTMKFSKAPNIYEGLNMDAYLRGEWIGASRGQIDELKETQAAVLRIKYQLSTHEDELAKQGKDWRKVNQQLKREKDDREEKGLILEEDNSINAASGSPREATESSKSRNAREDVKED